MATLWGFKSPCPHRDGCDDHSVTNTAGGPSRHVLLTGGSSGIGFQAVAQLLQAGHRLTVLCRDAATADRLRRQLSGRLQTILCDLADLASIEACADALLAAAGPIDSLVLNAGLQYSGAAEPRWSVQGFELTIAVNHLAHQALLQRLLPLLLQGTAPRLVVTASEVHDPSTAGGKVGRPAGLADLAGLRQGPGAAMLYALGEVQVQPPNSTEAIRLPVYWGSDQFLLAASFAIGSAVIAAWLPARKGSRVEPVDILRGAV